MKNNKSDQTVDPLQWSPYLCGLRPLFDEVRLRRNLVVKDKTGMAAATYKRGEVWTVMYPVRSSRGFVWLTQYDGKDLLWVDDDSIFETFQKVPQRKISKMTLKQPGINYRDFFAGTPKKIRYEVRLGSELFDIHILSGLVHDASFTYKDIMFQNEKLTIPIERLCWEQNDYVTHSMLTFKTVKDMKWTFFRPHVPDPDASLEINYFHLGKRLSDTDERFSFTICGHRWELEFSLENSVHYSIILRDLEVPHAYTSDKAT